MSKYKSFDLSTKQRQGMKKGYNLLKTPNDPNNAPKGKSCLQNNGWAAP